MPPTIRTKLTNPSRFFMIPTLGSRVADGIRLSARPGATKVAHPQQHRHGGERRGGGQGEAEGQRQVPDQQAPPAPPTAEPALTAEFTQAPALVLASGATASSATR